MLHIFWSCFKLAHFWRKARKIVQYYEIPNDPAFFLLHVLNIPGKKHKTSIIRPLLNAANSYIPLNWKIQHPPTISCWLHKVEEISKMDILIFTAQHKREK